MTEELHGWQARKAAQIEEYGTWRAATRIYAESGALAYDIGHPVPASNVDADGRVVVGRHYSPGELDEHHNKPTVWTEPGAAVRVNPPSKPLRSTITTPKAE